MTYEDLLAEIITQQPKAKKIIAEMQGKNRAPYQIIDTLEETGFLSQELKREYEKAPSYLSYKDED